MHTRHAFSLIILYVEAMQPHKNCQIVACSAIAVLQSAQVSSNRQIPFTLLNKHSVKHYLVGLPGYEGVLLSEVVSDPKSIKCSKGIGPQPYSTASLSGPRITLQHLTRNINLRATGSSLCTP